MTQMAQIHPLTRAGFIQRFRNSRLAAPVADAAKGREVTPSQ